MEGTSLVELILGPLGGGVAIGFGTGAAAGYGFAMRLCTNMKIPQLEEKIQSLSDLLEEVRKELMEERARTERIEELLEGVVDDEE
jgi:uncharacterized membrane protein YhiD involved in acid resistance